MKDEQILLEVDKRNRISLGELATKQRYLATLEPDGSIILTPAVVVPATLMQAPKLPGELAEQIDKFLEDPSQGVRLTRPDRTQR